MLFLAGCGPAEEPWEATFPTSSPDTPSLATAPLPTGGLELAPVRTGQAPDKPRPMPPMFQPAFHQALRWSYSTGHMTFRLRVPVGRAGQRVRLSFRSGDGELVLHEATLAQAGPDSSLASAPLAVTFSGAPGFSVGARTRVVSDPVTLPVSAGGELAVSFEVRGALGASAIESLPGGAMRPGAWASIPGPLGGTPWAIAVGLATVDVEGPPSRAFVAVGDSITEGYVNGRDDLRESWPFVATQQLGVPVVNAGVSGQGFREALRLLENEVLVLSGITDCVILLGTNDLSSHTELELQQEMTTLVTRLKPFCRTWVGTLLPKNRYLAAGYEGPKARRLVHNAWLRATWPEPHRLRGGDARAG